MKREDHVAQLTVALILQVVVLVVGFSHYGHGYPINEYLLADLFLGLSLLPVIAAFRRGLIAAKACALILFLLPACYIYLSFRYKGPISIQMWFDA